MSHDQLPPSVGMVWVNRIVWALAAISTLAVVSELGIPAFDHHPKHGDFWFDATFAFHAWYGFVSCVFLVLAAKVLRTVVMRPEDYYDE